MVGDRSELGVDDLGKRLDNAELCACDEEAAREAARAT